MAGNLWTKKGKFVHKLLFVSTTSPTLKIEQKPKHIINQYKVIICGEFFSLKIIKSR